MGGVKRKNRDAKSKSNAGSSPSVKVRKEDTDVKPLPPSRTGPQRVQPKSPTPSDESTWESSSVTSNSSKSSSQVSNSNPNTQPPVANHIRTPPIILTSPSWRKIAPTIFENPTITHDNLKAKILSDGNISVQTSLPETFRIVQKLLTENNISFHSFSLPEDRTMKVVLRGIPTDITEEEIKSDLVSRGFDINLVKRFGPISKPIPICLVILKKNITASEIYEISSMFYVSIKVESYVKSGPSQCFLCQRFGHGSSNCHQPLRCVKCSGKHNAKDCPKKPEDAPTCCNCGGNHTANYRGCPYYKHILETTTAPKPNSQIPNPPRKNIPPPTSQTTDQQQPKPQTPSISYANAASTSSNSSTTPTTIQNQINLSSVLDLLRELLITLSTTDNSKESTLKIVNSFIALLSHHG